LSDAADRFAGIGVVGYRKSRRLQGISDFADNRSSGGAQSSSGLRGGNRLNFNQDSVIRCKNRPTRTSSWRRARYVGHSEQHIVGV
jgi:hypothetical protein